MSEFRRRHYIMVAEIFKEARHNPELDQGTILVLEQKFVGMFERDNGRFQAERFQRKVEEP